ncbi:hypothetical protein LTR66_006532 [Elasticomyces elasticus]|nr:hypothetical protein LTR50_003446 [Elasticomyces elasticus]KAK4991498.1 hypothetical protein LTR66_006532 [Elasticomyces elasticus]
MDVSNMLAKESTQRGRSAQLDTNQGIQPHPHATRSGGISHDDQDVAASTFGADGRSSNGHGTVAGASSPGFTRMSGNRQSQKHVSFELLLLESHQHRARLPMRVMISPHDTTDSILSTVKNFYGLYEGQGVSFEDREGNTLIARYENFENDMSVYVRVIAPPPSAPSVSGRSFADPTSPRKPQLGPAFEMQRSFSHSQPHSRPASRTAHGRALSPVANRGRRSASAVPNSKSGNRSHMRSREPSALEHLGDGEGYNSSDGGNGSVTSSRRSKIEQHVTAEISLDNIVEGGRRKRAKFESSELPLFVPPQVPMTASISSVSPVRRVGSGSHPGASPYSYTKQHTFVYTQQPLPSPQSYGRSDGQNTQSNTMNNGHAIGAQQHGHQLRGRGAIVYPPMRQPGGVVLPTPDPTVGSVISDEDVALQLMRLGDVSNFSHGRTSTSTVDDALSGKAEVASDESDDDGERAHLPAVPRFPKSDTNHYSHSHGSSRKKQRMRQDNLRSSDSTQSSGDEYEDRHDGSFSGDSDEVVPDDVNGTAQSARKGSKARSTGGVSGKGRNSVASTVGNKPDKTKAPYPIKSKPKSLANGKVPISPSSLPPQSRKASNASTINFQHQLGVDEEDLSSKPRCQRCRKSKKGCDRQRPCQRCKDAGLGIEDCISEDEGNGRKGRYGRHMGVPVKKGDEEEAVVNSPHVGSNTGYFAMPAVPLDKSKKRKR